MPTTKRRYLIPTLLAVLLLLWIARGLDYRRMLQAAREAHYTWLLPAGAGMLLMLALRALRWRYLLESDRRIPFAVLWSGVLIGYFGNFALTANAGELLRAYSLGRRTGLSKSAALASIVVERLLDVIVLVAFLLTISLALPLPRWMETITLLAILLFVVGVVLLALLPRWERYAFALLDRLHRRYPSLPTERVARLLQSFTAGTQIWRRKRDLALAAALSGLVWPALATAFAAIGRALGLTLPWHAYLLVVSLITLGAIVPAPPGQVGTFEFLVVGGLSLFGVGKEQALTFALLQRLVRLLPLGLGYLSLVAGRRSLTASPPHRFALSPSRLLVLSLLAVYLILAVTYSLADPLYESTDELRHFRYVRHIAVYHTLPVQRPGAPRAQSHHPPLYYGLAALVTGWVPVSQEVYYQPTKNPFWGYHYWEVGADNKTQYVHGLDERFPFHGIALAVYLARWMTVVLGAGAVYLTYLIGREVFPASDALPLAAAAIVAFNPQFLYLAGAVNNDIPATLCSAAVLLLAVRLARRGPSLALDFGLGLLYGLGLLTKLNLAALLVTIELAYLLATVPRRDRWAFLRGNLIVLGLAALIAGWWFWRNYLLYGDPTGLSRVGELWAGRPPGENWWAIRQGLPYLWSSLWGRFGYGQVVMPSSVYRALLLLCALGLLAALRRFRAVRWLLLAHLLAFVGPVGYYILIQPAGAMGRFLFPALPAFAILLVGGLEWPDGRLRRVGAGLLILSLLALAVYALVAVLRPAFAPPRPLTGDEVAARPNPIAVEFGGVARLLGYDVTPTEVQPGDEVAVTLYWQPLARTEINYVVFVHLMSTVGIPIAQRDTYPGLGRYPTTTWSPGGVFADTYRLTVPETAYAPDRGYINVGLYQLDGPRLLTADGRDAVRLAAVSVRPRPGPLPNPVEVNFDSRLVLAGYELSRRTARPGETIRLTLYWRPPSPPESDYRIFAHVLGDENQVWANSDLLLPTSHWAAGQIVTDTHDLVPGEGTPPSVYHIEVGVYPPGGDRLPVIAEDGVQLGDHILLAPVRVTDRR